MIPIHYQTLLEKFLHHVKDCEGTDFIDWLNSYRSDVKFTTEEIAELNKIAKSPFVRLQSPDGSVRIPGRYTALMLFGRETVFRFTFENEGQDEEEVRKAATVVADRLGAMFLILED